MLHVGSSKHAYFSVHNPLKIFQSLLSVVYIYVKQKHLGCKKVRGQSEATLLTGMCDQKLWYQLRPRNYLPKLFSTNWMTYNSL